MSLEVRRRWWLSAAVLVAQINGYTCTDVGVSEKSSCLDATSCYRITAVT